MRIESANRLEFRPNAVGGHVVYNDGRQVAHTEGDFVTFSPTASLSLGELERIVTEARRHRQRLAVYDDVRESVRALCAYEQVPVPPSVTVVIDGMHCNVPMTVTP